MLDIVKNRIEIGLDKPVKLLHVTDTHLCDLDERDDDRKKWVLRNDSVEGNKQYFREAIDYCNDHCDMLVHGGDMYSLVSPRSIEVVREHLDLCKNYIVVAGNHEFSQYGGESWEGIAYKMTQYQTVRHRLGEDLLFASKVVGGVNVVAIDDGYYRVEDWQIWRLQREVKKGLPIVLLMHVPLYDEDLYQKSLAFWGKNNGAALIGCDENHLMVYSEYRAYQQRPTPSTMRFIDYVNSEPLIKCVLTGHIHFNHECTLPGGAVQLVTGNTYGGHAREITLY